MHSAARLTPLPAARPAEINLFFSTHHVRVAFITWHDRERSCDVAGHTLCLRGAAFLRKSGETKLSLATRPIPFVILSLKFITIYAFHVTLQLHAATHFFIRPFTRHGDPKQTFRKIAVKSKKKN